MDTLDAPATLDRAHPGQVVIVAGLEGPEILTGRLADLGFWPGARVEVVRRALFGDPTQYRLHGYRLALRRDEARAVLLEARP